MTHDNFKNKLSDYRLQKQKLINNTFLWATMAITSLEIISASEDMFKNQTKFKVPSAVKGKTVRRKPSEVRQIVKNAADKDIYFVLFTYIVAQFEGFLADTISLILKYDQRKLRVNVQGTDNNKKVDVSELLDCLDYESIIDLIIDRQLGALFYAGPKKQVEYMEKVLAIKIEEILWDDWFEAKATRDLIVHNSGIINKIYIEKAGTTARGKAGEKIVIDKKYFEHTCVLIKSLIGKIETQAKKIAV